MASIYLYCSLYYIIEITYIKCDVIPIWPIALQLHILKFKPKLWQYWSSSYCITYWNTSNKLKDNKHNVHIWYGKLTQSLIHKYTIITSKNNECRDTSTQQWLHRVIIYPFSVNQRVCCLSQRYLVKHMSQHLVEWLQESFDSTC